MADLPLADWLRTLDDDALTALLERRPDVLLGRPPATLGQLAERLEHPASLAAALRGLPSPALQVLQALQALGERRSRSALLGLLDGPPDDDERERRVDAVLTDLAAAGLVWPGTEDGLEIPTGLTDVFPAPFGLGPPARVLWSEKTADAISQALRALGGTTGGRKAEKLEALLALLADPEVVREQAAGAPEAVAEELLRIAWARSDEEDLDGRYDPASYRRRREAEQWAVRAGLLAGYAWGAEPQMPAEVALALRGPAFRVPFTPIPPAVPMRAVAAEAVEAAAAAAVTTFLTHALALLDRLARFPVPQLAGGGVGVRELRRLAKELAIEEAEVRLVLSLAADAGLLEPGSAGIGASDRYAEWRREEPAVQATSLLTAWWQFPNVPTRSQDADGKALPVLQGTEPCAGCQAGRVVLLQLASTLPADTAAEATDLARAARWQRPLTHVLPQDAGAPLATVAREAERLGVLAAGALSVLGAALLLDAVGSLEEHLRRLLPQASDSARFGSDLTALVAGTPSARVTALLDSCADRESSGGAVTWRFSPASVRRAMDDGTTAADLLQRLGEIAGRELPQPLTYLIGDVARRHGRLRLCPAVSLIRSDDEALLAEVAADRRLTTLRLERAAPTVLTCAAPLAVALARLREVGYFPVADHDDAAPPGAASSTPPPSAEAASRAGSAELSRTLRDLVAAARPRPDPRPEAAPATPAEVARQLLEAGDTGLPPATSGLAPELAHAAPQLSSSERDWLGAAIEQGGRVEIAYQAAGGAVTHRVIRDPELLAGTVYAWCELRNDERVFTAARILSVAPAE